MKKSFLSFLGFTAAQFCATLAIAQQTLPAESYPSGSTPPPAAAKATPVQKAQAKATRKTEGRAAAKADSPAEGNPVPDGATKVAKSDRRAARTERMAETKRANLAGEITSKGEAGATK